MEFNQNFSSCSSGTGGPVLLNSSQPDAPRLMEATAPALLNYLVKFFRWKIPGRQGSVLTFVDATVLTLLRGAGTVSRNLCDISRESLIVKPPLILPVSAAVDTLSGGVDNTGATVPVLEQGVMLGNQQEALQPLNNFSIPIQAKVFDFDKLSDAEKWDLVLKRCGPKTLDEATKFLGDVKLNLGETMQRDKVLAFLQTFDTAVGICGTTLVEDKTIQSIFFRSLGNNTFAEYLKRFCGLSYGVDYAASKAIVETHLDSYCRAEENTRTINQLKSRAYHRESSKSKVVVVHGEGEDIDEPLVRLKRKDEKSYNEQNAFKKLKKYSESKLVRNAVQKMKANNNNYIDKRKFTCFGCGAEGHRRFECPNKDCVGFRLRGNSTDRIAGVNAVVHSNGKVAEIDALVLYDHKQHKVIVGLDSMSTYDIIDLKVARKIGVTVVRLDSAIPVYTAGSEIPTEIMDYCIVDLVFGQDLGRSIQIRVKLLLMSVPTGVILGWSTIVKQHLLDLLEFLAEGVVSDISADEDDFGMDHDTVAVVSAIRAVSIYPQVQVVLNDPFIQDVFDTQLSLEPAKVPPLVIKLKDPRDLPPPQCYRRLSPDKLTFVDETIVSLLKAGIIRRSTSPVASALVVVNNHGKLRMCHDLRGLNDRILSINHPLPLLKDIILAATKYQYLVTMDLRKFYNQLPLDKESMYLTSFVTDKGQFEYTRVLFGLKTAVSHSQNTLANVVLHGLCHDICLVYLDDIVIGGDTEEILAKNVNKVMYRLKEFNLRVNIEKCNWGSQEINFLGFTVSYGKWKINDTKIPALRNLTIPTEVSELRKVLGILNYFRDFVPNFSIIACPLTELLKKDVVFEWKEKHSLALEELKRLVSEAPALFSIHADSNIIVRTDASKKGVGAVLIALEEREEKIVSFISQKFSSAAQNWSTIDQECYGIVYAVVSWRVYLAGRQFKIQTDHRNLLYLWRATEGRLGRWRITLQEFDYVVEHIPGIHNTEADTLSRCLVIEEPIKPAENMIKSVHNEFDGHFGVMETLNRLRAKSYNWKNMRSDVVRYIQECPICQKSRDTSRENSNRNLEKFPIESYFPFEEIAIDAIVNLPADIDGNTTILTAICCNCRFVELFPCKDVSAVYAARFLIQLMGRYGCIRYIRSDKGGEFVSDIFRELLSLCGGKPILTIGYRPQANGTVERVNGEVMRHLRAIVLENYVSNHWSILLPLVSRILNARVHSTTGVAPAEVVYGCIAATGKHIIPCEEGKSLSQHEYVNLLTEGQRSIIKSSQRYLAEMYDSQSAVSVGNEPIAVYKVGDYVLVKRPEVQVGTKLSPIWSGPYIVTGRPHGNDYSVRSMVDDTIHTYNIDIMKLYIIGSNQDLQVVNAWDFQEGLVEKILNHRRVGAGKKGLEFLVKFQKLQDACWLPYMECRHVFKLTEYMLTKPELKELLDAESKAEAARKRKLNRLPEVAKKIKK